MAKVGSDVPKDEEEKSKWDELLALPPQGSEVFLGGIPLDTTEEDLRELCEPVGEIYEVSESLQLFVIDTFLVSYNMECDVMSCNG
jgi:RNA recognition motif-containing protein